jgi:hypothetical protein
MALLREQQDPVTVSPQERGRRWPRWVAAAGGALVLALVAFLLGTGHGQPSPTPPTPPPGGSGASVPAPDLAGQPDGCLGGADPYTAILPAQQQATLDAAGAVGFARSAFRYLVKSYPRPADAQAVVPQVFVNPAPWLATLAKPEAAPQPPPAGTTTQYVRASETTYRVTTAGQTADVTVDLILELDYPDGTNSQVRLTQRFLLQAVGGHWMIADAPATDPLPAAGAAGVFYVPGGC